MSDGPLKLGVFVVPDATTAGTLVQAREPKPIIVASAQVSTA